MAQHPTYEALEKRVKDLEKEVVRRKGVEAEVGQRVKELNCLYDILRLDGKQDISQEELLQEIVSTILPLSWRYPETTRARITLEGREFETEDFRETPWKQACDIMAFGERIGCLEVFYLEDKPGNDEGSFLKGERSLISAISKHFGRIAERKWTEKAMRTSHLFLEVANMHIEMKPLLEEFVRQVKELTGCDAVGIRLLGRGGDIPYEAYDGFDQRFYESESPLSIISDRCMCINVIKGTTDPNLAFFTKGGSFYVNGTTLFLATVPEGDKGQSRNVCNAHGYESVALVPIRLRDRILGLIHVADRKEGMVPLEMVELMEGIAIQLGSAIQRVRAEEALRKKEATMKSIFRAAPIGIGLVSNRVLGWTNEQILTMTGYSSEELMGKSARILYPSDKEFEWVGKDKYAQIKEWGTGTVETCWKRKDGRVINVLLSSTPLDLLDLSAGVTFTALDITDRKKAEEERESLIKELEAKNAELEQFMYTVSHDLKSPLITIKGFLGVLEKDAAKGDSDRMKADMVRISNAAEKMRSLLDELLEFSRAGRLVNPPKEALFEDLAREAMDVVAGRLAERNVHVEIAPGLPMIYGDVPRIQEVLENLIDNAVKYMGDQPNPHVEIGARQDGEERVLYIQDNGVGIDPRYHEKIFGLFDKLEPNSDGTGVGLAIVKRIIEVHGGRIWIESDGAGTGSAFCFTIPDKRESKMLEG